MSRFKLCPAMVTAADQCLMGEDEVAELVKLSRAKRCIEIGSFRGGSAKAMLPDCKYLVCIDPHEDMWWTGVKNEDESDCKGKEVQADFLNAIAPWEEKCLYIQKYSHDVDLEWVEFTDHEFLFIDGDHSYEGCYHDLTKFVPIMQPHSIVACHDYSLQFTGVIAACINYFHRFPDYVINTLAVYQL